MTILERAIADGISTLQSLPALQPQVDRAATLIGECLIGGGKLLVCGNGGSAADGADFATEFACRFITDRKPYPAIDLTASGSLTTAIGNDYAFEEVFARQVRAFGKTADVLIGISTSGNSPNVIAALHAAREMGMRSIAVLGREGGRARGIADVELVVAGAVTARIQEAHKFLLHILCQMVEEGWLLKAK
jgi:D-sedoheptulose 7-phosphate isomerase